MSRMFLPGVLKLRYQGGFSLKRALTCAILGGVVVLIAVPFWPTPGLQAQSQDPIGDMRFGPATNDQEETTANRDLQRKVAAVTTAGLTLTAPTPGIVDKFGESVSNAGDVNGDGHDDIIVGCSGCDIGALTNAGKAFIFFGGPLLDTVVDVTLQAPSPAPFDRFGISVSTAGDVDGDGFDDVIVGCYLCDVSGNNNEGKAFVFHGGSAMDGTADKTLTTPSPASEDNFGRSVSTAGDVNGDGFFDDVIVGCGDCDMGSTSNVGKAFIFFGPDMDITAAKTLEPTLRGGSNKAVSSAFGRSVATAGDVNGDDYNDVVVGCHRCDVKNTDRNEGKAFIFFGGPNMDTTVDKTLTAPSPARGDEFGGSVATAGDVDGDGAADVIVGCPACEVDGIRNPGKAFLFFGGSSMDEVADKELHMPNPQVDQFFGVSVNSGDLNGDGFADVVVGCSQCNVPPYDDAGQAFVFLGGLNMDEIVDETLQAPAPARRDHFGHSVSTFGDVNEDGLADLILGCHRCDIVKDNDEGKAFLRFGEALVGTITGTVTDSSTNSPIQGATVSASTGQSDTTDASGEYTLNTVPAGNPTVTASASGYVTQSMETTVTDGETVVQNVALEPESTAVGTGTVKGKVTDANTGKNLAGVLVETDTDQSATTGKSGRYTIENVPEGVREVTASKGSSTETRTVTVTAGETAVLDFELGS